MAINVVPHLNFRGDARAALGFYQSAFGGTVTIITYQDMGNVEDPSEGHQVVWGQVVADDGFEIMAYDVPSSRPWSQGEAPFFVSVRGDDADELARYWEGLASGADVVVPLGPSAWAPLYGMLTDRYGVTWVLDIAVAYDPS